MLGIRFLRLIERHSAALSSGLAGQILSSERTSDFRKIPATDLQVLRGNASRSFCFASSVLCFQQFSSI